MKTFRFRLEQALTWRKLQQDQEQLALGKLFRRLEELEHAIAAVACERASVGRDLVAASHVDGRELAALSAYRERLARETLNLESLRQQQQRLTAEQRTRCIEAARRVRLLDKLKDRQRADWQYEAGREEERTASENFLAQWGK